MKSSRAKWLIIGVLFVALLLDTIVKESKVKEVVKPVELEVVETPPKKWERKGWDNEVKKQTPKHESPSISAVVDDMPRFPGCELLSSSERDKKKCSDKKIAAYIRDNLQYPQTAQEQGIEGVVNVYFVVDETGNIIDPKVSKDIGGGCGAEAIRVVASMNDMPEKWKPGMQQGKPVKVFFAVPVLFRLKD